MGNQRFCKVGDIFKYTEESDDPKNPRYMQCVHYYKKHRMHYVFNYFNKNDVPSNSTYNRVERAELYRNELDVMYATKEICEVPDNERARLILDGHNL